MTSRGAGVLKNVFNGTSVTIVCVRLLYKALEVESCQAINLARVMWKQSFLFHIRFHRPRAFPNEFPFFNRYKIKDEEKNARREIVI